MYELIRDTKRMTNERIYTGTLQECRDELDDIVWMHKYEVSEFTTAAGWEGTTIIKSPYSSNPMKIFYIKESENV